MTEKNTSSYSGSPADIKQSLRLISSNLNNLVFIAADFAVDQVAQKTAGQEISQIYEDPKSRKELDEALSRVLHYYLPDLGPGIAYLVCLGANLGSRYEFEALEETIQTTEESKTDESESKIQSSDDTTDGATGARKNDDSVKRSSTKRNTSKKKTSKKRSSTRKTSKSSIPKD